MLDPALLRGQLDTVAERLAKRGFVLDKAAIEALEAQRKSAQTETQELQNLRNTISKAVGIAKGKGEDASALLAEVAGVGDKLKANERRLAEIQHQLAEIALGLPNLPDDSVPVGSDETQNVELQNGEIRFAGAEEINIIEGTIGLNHFDGNSFLLSNLLDVLGDLEISPFG